MCSEEEEEGILQIQPIISVAGPPQSGLQCGCWGCVTSGRSLTSLSLRFSSVKVKQYHS